MFSSVDDSCRPQQAGKFAAAVVEPLAPAPALPDLLPAMPPAEPDAVPPLMEPVPVVEPAVFEPDPERALFSWTLPLLSLQCVAAEMLPEAPAPVVEPGEELDCAAAANAPPATNADASRRVLMAFMETLRVKPPRALNA